jgi:hypothetical protein
MAGGGAVSVRARIAARVLGEPVPAGELPHPLPPGVTVRRNRLIPIIGGWFMGGSHAPAAAVTFGRTILLDAGCTPTDDLIVHELVHVEQWRDPLFALKYAAEWMRHGYRQNRYEQEAYARQREYAAAKPNPAPTRSA